MVQGWDSRLESRRQRLDPGRELPRALCFALGGERRHTEVLAGPGQSAPGDTLAYLLPVEIQMGNKFRKQGGSVTTTH